MTTKEYIRAIDAAGSKITLDKIIYYCGFDRDLNESEVKFVLLLAINKQNKMKQTARAEKIRINNRSIEKIQA